MSEILFLCHRIPFPPDRGDKIRSHHVLKALAKLAPVHVGTFADDEGDEVATCDLEALAASSYVAERSMALPLAGAKALLSRKPVSLTAFRDAGLADYIRDTLNQRNISAIYVFSGQMGQYVPANWQGRLVIDFVDVDSAKFEAYASHGNPAMRLINAREGRLLKAEEARLAARADASLLVSDEEAALFSSRLPEPAQDPANVRALYNGIDTRSFDPFTVLPEPKLASFPAPRLIFTGQMDYQPNVAAVQRAVRRLMPRIRSVLPEASFHIVGRNPSGEVLALDGVAGCKVWGRVDNIADYLRACDLALIPLEIARGVQNKVLEAMAMAMPVVVSRGAATGIGATEGRELAIGDDDDALVRQAITLLRDRQKAITMGLAARRYLEQNRSWAAALAPLPGLIGFPAQGVSDAA